MQQFDLAEYQSSGGVVSELEVHAEIGSTNTRAAELARAGAVEGFTVLAESQLAGRGRRGSQWHSPFAANLLFSTVLRPRQPRSQWGVLALSTGLAVAKSLAEKCQLDGKIKWPNDLWINGLKCCGILVEAENDFVIAGVGLNVSASPDHLAATDLRAQGCDISREALLAHLVSQIVNCSLDAGLDKNKLLDEIRSYDGLLGKRISLLSQGSEHRGTMAGIGDDGEILLDCGGQLESFVQADQVRPIEEL